jgi:hypothetical protein
MKRCLIYLSKPGEDANCLMPINRSGQLQINVSKGIFSEAQKWTKQ